MSKASAMDDDDDDHEKSVGGVLSSNDEIKEAIRLDLEENGSSTLEELSNLDETIDLTEEKLQELLNELIAEKLISVEDGTYSFVEA